MPKAAARNADPGGFRTSFVRSSDAVMVMKRTFEAPASVLFDAWTRPELVRRWWAPKSRGVVVSVCEADVREGGAWRYVLTRNAEVVCEFKGEYLRLEPPTRLEYTSFLTPLPDPVMTVVTFEEKDGLTHMTTVETYPSKQALDQAVGYGMEEGALETIELLADLVRGMN